MPQTNLKPNEPVAQTLDERDPMKHFRERFHFPAVVGGGEPVYFTGNSLGLMPKTARGYVEQELADWEKLAVDAHVNATNPWLPYHEFLTDQTAHIIGAMPIETVVMNSLTVNLHLLLVSFYRPEGKRRKIVIEKGAFPSDQYAVKSQIGFHQYGSEPPALAGGQVANLAPSFRPPARAGGSDWLIELSPRDGESTLRTEDIIDVIEREGDEIALVLLGGVNYYTGQAFDMKAITAAGQKIGAVVGFDLAHAAGNIELKMHDWDVDFAAWCSYKYLNGGPGAVGGAFIHERHANNFDLPRFAGWWGHDKASRFLMGPEFQPIPGAEGWQVSNPAVLQMAAMRASLDIFEEAGMDALIKKSRKLTGYLEFLIDKIADESISIITPRAPEQRGCQLSMNIKDDGKVLYEKLLAKGISVDWREPSVIRAAPVPLYNSFADVHRFVEILKDCLN
ncbi:MAG: kynureninase [Pyrinomonadaceae bacterium]